MIDGEKTWISNAGIADFYVVFARTAEQRREGPDRLCVDAATPGLSVIAAHRNDLAASARNAALRRLRVPASDSVSARKAQGFKIAMATLDVFRSTVGAAALGFARRALTKRFATSNARQLFGAPLATLQLTQAAIAEMATDVDASALLVYRAAWEKDGGAARVTREAAMAKWFATEAAGRICDRAVQLFGGRGVTRGEIVERLYRDVRALRIYEGASEIQQLVIAKQMLERVTARATAHVDGSPTSACRRATRCRSFSSTLPELHIPSG